ncbi:MAG: extracellular solute-binding protein, partial [Bacillota bacterium]
MKKYLFLAVLAILCCSFISVNAQELTLWSIATESDAFHDAYLQAIAEFEEANPGVTIKMETFENESYKIKIKSAVAANDLPDIFYTWGGGFSSAFVESGKVLPLDDYSQPYAEGISKAALGNVIYDGKLYGVSYVTPVSVI